MPRAPASVALIARFGLAGAANTALGLLLIAVLDLGLGVNPHIANAAGYAAGLVLSFQLNRSFVFRQKTAVLAAGRRFLVAAGCAFALNQAVLAATAWLLGSSDLARLAAQAAGVAAYTVALFILSRLWVFRADSAAAA
jgi:putative flippase GtrA